MANGSNLQGYKPSGFNASRTTLLQDAKEGMKVELEPIKKLGKKMGDYCFRWMDVPSKRSLINVMAVTKGGAIFMKSVNMEDERR